MIVSTSNVLSQLIKNISGELIWDIIIIIAITMPTWILLTELKEKWKTYKKRRRLINDALLSIDTYAVINGIKGVIKEIGKDRITIEGDDNFIYYIPIDKAVDEIIAKKNISKDSKKR